MKEEKNNKIMVNVPNPPFHEGAVATPKHFAALI